MSPTSKEAKEFADYASSIFLRRLEEVSKLDVVWDTCRYMYDHKRGSIGEEEVADMLQEQARFVQTGQISYAWMTIRPTYFSP